LIDSWLLNLFPGRTLEELDEMDLNRFYRAKLAQQIQFVEERRKLFLQGKLKSKDLTVREWEMIVEHDRLLNQEN
jgi:hypothetical protein